MPDRTRVSIWEDDASGYVNATRVTRDPLRHELLIPKLLELTGDLVDAVVLDAGCGDGALAASLVERGARKVVGLDVSDWMIRRCCARGIRAVCCYRHDIEQGAIDLQADICIANMVLHLLANVADAIANLRVMLRPGAVAAVTIPHPAFHMQTAEIEALSKFDSGTGIPAWLPTESYATEHAVVNTFGEPSLKLHMFHRSLGDYCELFSNGGFEIERLLEPVFPSSLEGPLAVWQRLPPFALFRLRRT